MTPFDLEKARQGAPVCTRVGRPARIICFDRRHMYSYPIVALITKGDGTEDLCIYKESGVSVGTICEEGPSDLMMVGEEHEGWVNIYRDEQGLEYTGNDVYKTKEDAVDAAEIGCVATIKIEWEE